MTRLIRIALSAAVLGLCVSLAGAAPPKDLGTALAAGDLVRLQQDLNVAVAQPVKSASDMGAVLADPALIDRLAVWQLINVVGAETLAKIRTEPEGKPFLEWLGRHPRAVEDYLSSGDPREYNLTGLSTWLKIWAAYPESREGPLLRLAEASALIFALPLNNMADGKPVDPVARFGFFSKSYKSGALFPYFEKALTWELRYVVDSWAPDDNLEWVRGKIAADLKNQARIGDACWMVPYRDKNAKGVSVQEGAKYYDNKPMTLQLMVEVGGVCGAISRFGTSAAQAFGIPAMPVTQPGHCAHIWRDKEGSWRVGQDINGWAGSGEHDGIRTLFGARPTYVLLVDAAMADPKAFATSQRLFWASALSPSLRVPLLAKAVTADPFNFPVLRAYLGAAKAAEKGDAYAALLLKVCRPLGDYPYALCDLLVGNLDGLLASPTTDRKTRDFIEGILQTIADGDPAKQVGCARPWSAFFFGTVLRYATNTRHDFEAPIREGQDAGKVWEKLDQGSRMDWLRCIEIALNAGMKRKELYEQPLNLYAEIVAKDKSAGVRGIPVLGAMVKQAVSSGAGSFASDASRKLADLCEKAGDKSAAEEWRKLGS